MSFSIAFIYRHRRDSHLLPRRKQDDMPMNFNQRCRRLRTKSSSLSETFAILRRSRTPHGVDYIFHAAALAGSVPRVLPMEAVKTNVIGTKMSYSRNRGGSKVGYLPFHRQSRLSRKRNGDKQGDDGKVVVAVTHGKSRKKDSHIYKPCPQSAVLPGRVIKSGKPINVTEPTMT